MNKNLNKIVKNMFRGEELHITSINDHFSGRLSGINKYLDKTFLVMGRNMFTLNPIKKEWVSLNMFSGAFVLTRESAIVLGEESVNSYDEFTNGYNFIGIDLDYFEGFHKVDLVILHECSHILSYYLGGEKFLNPQPTPDEDIIIEASADILAIHLMMVAYKSSFKNIVDIYKDMINDLFETNKKLSSNEAEEKFHYNLLVNRRDTALDFNENELKSNVDKLLEIV